MLVPMGTSVTILGAGFGGLELASVLSEELGAEASVTLIDRNDSFIFGYSKLDLMFGRARPEEVRLPYGEIAKPGVRFLRETVTAIDPSTRNVQTDQATHHADVLVIALGADYDMDATPGLAEHGNEFYTFAGAERLSSIVAGFRSGRAIIGVCGAPFKCPPAPSEAALLLHDSLVTRGVRGSCEITFVIPLATPVPPSPETSEALLAAFAERAINFIPSRRVSSLDGDRGVAILDDGGELAYDLFLGVPKHRAPDVVIASGMIEETYIPVNPRTLETRFPGVYAIGDVATITLANGKPLPKAGVFAHAEALVVAESLAASVEGGAPRARFDGQGYCWVELGGGQAAFATGNFYAPGGPQIHLRRPGPHWHLAKAAFEQYWMHRWL